MPQELQGRVAMVTGGVSGIGRACALALAEAGASVSVGSFAGEEVTARPAVEDTYYPPPTEFETVRAEIAALGVDALAMPLDVCDDRSVDEFTARTVEELGPVDIVVTAAGLSAMQPVAEHNDELWLKIIDTNLNGNYRVIKRVLPSMIERRWGRVVIIGSTSASVGAAGQSAYSAAKAGLLGLMRCVALEVAPHGITCNMVSPATVETRMMQTAFAHKAERSGGEVGAHRAELLECYPQGRFLRPDEIAAAVAFLAGDRAEGITMENLGVTGGAIY